MIIDSIGWRTGWGFVLVSLAALAAFWYLRGPMQMGWAAMAYLATAIIVSIAAFLVVLQAFIDAGSGGEREWWALSELYALVNDTPWWGKATVVLSGVAWALV